MPPLNDEKNTKKNDESSSSNATKPKQRSTRERGRGTGRGETALGTNVRHTGPRARRRPRRDVLWIPASADAAAAAAAAVVWWRWRRREFVQPCPDAAAAAAAAAGSVWGRRGAHSLAVRRAGATSGERLNVGRVVWCVALWAVIAAAAAANVGLVVVWRRGPRGRGVLVRTTATVLVWRAALEWLGGWRLWRFWRRIGRLWRHLVRGPTLCPAAATTTTNDGRPGR